ncbi:MAG: toll/interleukin-1 receptor domain-containing protein [Hyphomonadaceae bacterium]|nr:toll/interleukin-1 receptor domain-containing protein [Hyphomonadaceae bacterium]
MAGRIYDALEKRFGRDRLFKDVDNLRPGAEFGEHIKALLPRCRVALILIGPNWVNAVDEEGRRRLDDPHDWVRVEIEIALAASGLDVVPVLVNGASMPRANELPESLHPLLRRHAASIRPDPDFRDDIDRLATALRASVRTGLLDLGVASAQRQVVAPKVGAFWLSLLSFAGAIAAVETWYIPVVWESRHLIGVPFPGTSYDDVEGYFVGLPDVVQVALSFIGGGLVFRALTGSKPTPAVLLLLLFTSLVVWSIANFMASSAV